MRNHVLFAALLATMLAPPLWAHAGTHTATTTVDDYSWQDNGKALGLHSETGRPGIFVSHVAPEPFHGLRRGDVLVAADGRPLHQVEELMRMLRGRTSPLALRVQRGQRLTTLVWSQADYRDFAPSARPMPPPPSPSAPSAPHN